MYAVVGDAATAEDCVQEAFVRAYRAWPRFRPDRPAEAWIHQIAVNTAISHWRRQQLRAVGEVIRRLGRPAPPADPSDVVADRDVIHALASLPPKLSVPFVLRHYHGYTNREIVAITGAAERTVGLRIAQARARLGAMLGGPQRLPTSQPSRVPLACGNSAGDG